jgi:hypothetical protein
MEIMGLEPINLAFAKDLFYQLNYIPYVRRMGFEPMKIKTNRFTVYHI